MIKTSIANSQHATVLTLSLSERIAAARALAVRLGDAGLDTTGIDTYLQALMSRHWRGAR